jgi:ligand-binding SRPBCC domain-containing protein
MPRIHLTTFIAAPVERVFDLSRNLTLYKLIFQSRKENFSSGAASNLLAKGETVSVVSKLAGKSRMSMIKVMDMQRPLLFTEEQVKGDLRNYRHEHHFKPIQNGTIVIDLVDFDSAKDMIGRMFGKLYLRKYLEELLRKRNEMVRSYAETEKWRAVLS